MACPGAGAASGAGEGAGEGVLRLEGGVEVAAVELDDARGRGGEGDEDAGGVDGAGDEFGGGVGAEGDLLPGGVSGDGGGAGFGAEGAGAGAGDDEPFSGELGEGAGDGHRGDAVPLDEGPTRRQLSTW